MAAGTLPSPCSLTFWSQYLERGGGPGAGPLCCGWLDDLLILRSSCSVAAVLGPGRSFVSSYCFVFIFLFNIRCSFVVVVFLFLYIFFQQNKTFGIWELELAAGAAGLRFWMVLVHLSLWRLVRKPMDETEQNQPV